MLIIYVRIITLGWFGFSSSVAGIAGGLGLSYLADRHYFNHSLKVLIMISLIASTLCIVWFELCVPSIFYDHDILSSTVITIGLSTGLAGLFAGAVLPLILEALAEITHPLPESLSASILVECVNIATLILLFIAPKRDKIINFSVLVIMILCIILVLLTRFTYRRRDEDERKRIEKEQNQTTNTYYDMDQSSNHIINRSQYGTFSETHEDSES